MKLTNVLDYWLNGDIIREAKDETRPGDVYVNKRNGEVFLVLNYLNTKFGRKWSGVEFNFKPRYGNPYISAGSSTTVAEPKAFEGYKKTKLTAKQKKAIQKMLKDPENLDQLDRAGTRVKDIERYIR